MMEFEIRGNIIFNNVLWQSQTLYQMREKFDTFLNQKGINRNMTIALAMDRTPILLISIMCLLNNEIVFLPINKELPSERLEYMLATADVDFIITDGTWIQKRQQNCSVLLFNPEEIDDTSIEAVTYKDARKQELAYLLFTSGSTGKPKAVEVLRSGLINFVQAIMKRIDFPDETRIACCTNEMFDIFFLESVLALHAGMTVVLANEDERKNPRKICRLLLEQRVNVIQMTPSYLQMIHLTDSEYCCLQNMNVIMVGGENFPLVLLEELRSASRAKIYNMYGPTETTIWSLIADLSYSSEVIIGQPISETEVYILNEQEEIVQDGMEGEICISGAGVARGYRNNEEQTKYSFKELVLDKKEIRIYKTGDLGYERSDGNYVCLGRKDTQVKILGHRIELEEIDECVKQISDIKDAVSCVHEDQRGKRIVCFYISDKEKCTDDFRGMLTDKLPSYMMPSVFVRVDDFLYTISSKLDRNAMIRRYYEEVVTRTEKDKVVKNGIEGWVIRILSDLCGFDKKQIDSQTLIESIGMDSLMYIDFIVQVEDKLCVEIDDEYLASDSFSTVGDIIKYFKYLCAVEEE